MKVSLLFGILAVAAFHSTVVYCQSCSEIELIKECECKMVATEVEIRCKGLNLPSQVQSALMSSKDCTHLIIEDSFLPSLPLDLGPHPLRNLSIVNTKMPYISPPHEERSAFDGLKELYRIRLDGVTDITDWDWSKLKDLPNLAALHVNDGALVHIPKSFSSIGESNLEELTLGNCNLMTIADGGLAFPKLKVLQILDDPLEELKSQMFHQDNEIETLLLYGLTGVRLSPDLFNSMKNLKYLNVDSKVFSSITEEHFRGKQLEEFNLFPGDVMYKCDCNHRWLLLHRNAYLGFCSDQDDVTVDFKEYLEKC